MKDVPHVSVGPTGMLCVMTESEGAITVTREDLVDWSLGGIENYNIEMLRCIIRCLSAALVVYFGDPGGAGRDVP